MKFVGPETRRADVYFTTEDRSFDQGCQETGRGIRN